MTVLCDLYLRLSDGRNENGTFAEREETLRHKALARGWQVRKVVIENDMMNGRESASAFKRRKVKLADGSVVMRVWRPGFRSMLEDLKAGRVQAILAEDLDRAVRDPRDLEDMIDVMESTKGWADSLSGSLKFTAGGTDGEITMARMMVAVANKSSRDMSRRQKLDRERKAQRGIWAGGRRPYGFTPVPNPHGNHQNTELVICEEEAKEIREAANQLLAGISLKAVARDMISRGVATVTGAKWSAETLRDVMLKGLNARILHEDVHQAVVALLSDPKRSQPGRAATWLGTNIYQCICGSPMEIQAGTTRAPSYRCARDGGKGSLHVRRNALQLDSFIESVIIARLSRKDAVVLFAKQDTKIDLKSLRAQADALKELRLEIMRDRDEGLIDRAEMRTRLERNRSKLEAIEAKLAANTERSPLEGVAGADDVQAAWNRASLGRRREIVRTLMCVTVLPVSRRGRGFDPESVKITPR